MDILQRARELIELGQKAYVKQVDRVLHEFSVCTTEELQDAYRELLAFRKWLAVDEDL